jgi:hypothetical protein
VGAAVEKEELAEAGEAEGKQVARFVGEQEGEELV